MTAPLTTPEAAAYLGVAPRTLLRYVEDDLGLPHYRLGRELRFDRTDLDAFLAKRCRVDPIYMGDI